MCGRYTQTGGYDYSLSLLREGKVSGEGGGDAP